MKVPVHLIDLIVRRRSYSSYLYDCIAFAGLYSDDNEIIRDVFILLSIDLDYYATRDKQADLLNFLWNLDAISRISISMSREEKNNTKKSDDARYMPILLNILYTCYDKKVLHLAPQIMKSIIIFSTDLVLIGSAFYRFCKDMIEKDTFDKEMIEIMERMVLYEKNGVQLYRFFASHVQDEISKRRERLSFPGLPKDEYCTIICETNKHTRGGLFRESMFFFSLFSDNIFEFWCSVLLSKFHTSESILLDTQLFKKLLMWLEKMRNNDHWSYFKDRDVLERLTIFVLDVLVKAWNIATVNHTRLQTTIKTKTMKIFGLIPYYDAALERLVAKNPYSRYEKAVWGTLQKHITFVVFQYQKI